MKNLITLVLLLMGINLFAQCPIPMKDNGGPYVIADKISIDTDSNIQEFSRNVSFTAKRFHIKGADNVVYNPKTKEVTATGGKCTESGINGVIIAREKCTPENTLYHKLGSKKLYINKHCR